MKEGAGKRGGGGGDRRQIPVLSWFRMCQSVLLSVSPSVSVSVYPCRKYHLLDGDGGGRG